MGNHHSHSHDHSHGHTTANYNRAFAVGIGLNLIFVGVEIFYGLLANSSALLADAGHNAGDVLGLVFAWFAMWVAKKKPKGRYTFGYKKTTILISVLNAMLLFGAVGAIGWDAAGKFANPDPVAGNQIIIVALIGVVINTITAIMFIKGQKEDLNIKGAFLHMAADAAVSLGVVIAGIIIINTGWYWVDPVMSFIIIAVIMWGTWRLFVDSVNLALDAVPRNIDVNKVREYILSKDNVVDIHDFHIWAMSTTQVALTAHVVVERMPDDDFLSLLQYEMNSKFKIPHTTFQIETANGSCTVHC